MQAITAKTFIDAALVIIRGSRNSLLLLEGFNDTRDKKDRQ